MVDSSDTYELDLLAPELLGDPYRTYARLRANRGVHYRSPSGVCSVVSRYADVRLMLLDPRFRAAASPMVDDVEPFADSVTSTARALIGELHQREAFDLMQEFVEPLARDALTASAIGNAILALLTHHDQLKWLHHGARLPDATVDELLRYDSPLQRTSRIALVDVELPEGDTIAAGERVT